MKKVILAALLCTAFAAPAQANWGWKHRGDGNHDRRGHVAGNHEAKINYLIDRMDTNRDGVISLREHESFNAHMFHKTDANRDGVLTPREIEAFLREEEAKRKGLKDGRDQDGFNQ